MSLKELIQPQQLLYRNASILCTLYATALCAQQAKVQVLWFRQSDVRIIVLKGL